MSKNRLTLLGILGILMVLVMSGCGYNIPPDMVALHIKNGPTDSKKVVGCVDSATRKHSWQTNDDYPVFPTSEREWDATGQKGSDASWMQSVTKDNVQMDIPITFRFTLITQVSDPETGCQTLEDFYNKYVRRNGAEFHTDGTYNDQWETTLRKLIADPGDQTLDRIVQGYNWRQVWNDPATKVKIEQQMDESLNSDSSLLIQTAKEKFFTGVSVLIGNTNPHNKDLAAQVASEQTLVAQAQAQQAQANADIAKAKAQTKVAKADAAKQRAIIEGYRLKGMSAAQALQAYNLAQAIAAGQNPFQPSYIVSGTVPPRAPSTVAPTPGG